MSYYTSGEDLIYRLDVTTNTTITITMNPGTTTYGGVGIFQGCPGTGTCLGAAFSSAATPKVISQISLTAGIQYYIMVDTWASPTCIPSLTLDIIAVTPPPPPPPGTIEIGNGTTYGSGVSVYAPWSNYWHNCHTQTLYLASELGAPIGKKFTQLAWKFGVLPNTTNYLNNVTIKIKETAATALTSGAYVDMSDATQVFYAATFVPATATGWRVIDINDYIWTGSSNIIVDVLWGDNGYYVSPYFQTYKTNSAVNRQIVGYADAETPPNYDGITTYYDNMRWYWDPLSPPGNLEGYVFNYDGLSIAGATIAINGGPSTTSGPDGSYQLTGINSGDQTVVCYKAGYNAITEVLTIVSNQTLIHNFTLTQPNMVVNPLFVQETLNPNEYFTTSMNILNNGNGPLDWQAAINLLSMPILPCEYSIALYDTFGDGWNGCSIDVLVNGVVVLDNITLSSGSGPVFYYFTVISGDEITTTFTPGSWTGEPYYYIYNSAGDQVWYSPPASAGPPSILPGQLNASCSGTAWLTMDDYSGTVPAFGGVDNIPTHLNAANTTAGEIYTGEIVFTSTPNVGTITVPVTMIIMGNPLMAPENLEAELINDVTGQVGLTWDWNGDAFQFFLIKRDGVIVGTTTNTSYVDILPDYGDYCYTVQAVYDEGATSPAGPACIEWPNPVLYVNPDDLHGWVWQGFTVDVYTTISNLGEGTLAFTFPEFAALNLLNDPTVEKNTPGSPIETRGLDLEKGDVSQDGTGYPIVLGAGGPDAFGYVWIDSDEAGGPAFNWMDIAATGSAVPTATLGDDGKAGPYNLAHEFEYYGEAKSQFWVASNGAVCFTSAYHTYTNTGIPTNNSANVDFIAGFWDDLYSTYAGCAVYYQSFADYTIVQYNNTSRLGASAYTMDMQFILYRNGKIKVQYKDITAGFTLNSATIGIQSSDPGLGLQVSSNTNYVHNNLALLFSLPADFIIDVEPAFGTIAEGESRDITITYDSQDYEPGDYTQELMLESNDPNNGEYIINNTMHVYVPAQFAGFVTDHDGGDPLPGVTVTAGQFQTTTNDEGAYSLFVDQGEYDVIFEN